MIITLENIQPQIENLIKAYPNLSIMESNSSMIRLHGSILIHRVLHDFPLRKTYNIDICIPLNSTDLPYIIDTDNAIDTTYHHRYPDGRLCLETDSRIKIHFINGFDLLEWMDVFVEPYFVSYEFYQLYGQFPTGERGHDIIGVMDYYQEFFHVDNVLKTYKMMEFVTYFPYRGHCPCPCESNLPLRKCHGEWLLPIYKDKRIKHIVINDYIKLKEFLNETRKH